jgi:hypothetical protein
MYINKRGWREREREREREKNWKGGGLQFGRNKENLKT